jgi:hypothetical protein
MKIAEEDRWETMNARRDAFCGEIKAKLKIIMCNPNE